MLDLDQAVSLMLFHSFCAKPKSFCVLSTGTEEPMGILFIKLKLVLPKATLFDKVVGGGGHVQLLLCFHKCLCMFCQICVVSQNCTF